MNTLLQQNLQNYIDSETNDMLIYRELAKMAPAEESRQLLLEFAEDEQTHASELRQIYRSIYGRSYTPEIKNRVIEGTFYEIIRERIINESADYRKYNREYLVTEKNERLRSVFHNAANDEIVHAQRLVYILSGY